MISVSLIKSINFGKRGNLRGQNRRWQLPGSFEGTLKIVEGNRSDGDVKNFTNVCLFAWNCLE